MKPFPSIFQICIAIIFSPKLLIHFSFDSFILVNEGDFSRPEKKNKNTNEVNTYENITKKSNFRTYILLEYF